MSLVALAGDGERVLVDVPAVVRRCVSIGCHIVVPIEMPIRPVVTGSLGLGGRQTRGCKQNRGGYGSHNLSRHIQLHVGFSWQLGCGNPSKVPRCSHPHSRPRYSCRLSVRAAECCNVPMRQVVGTNLKLTTSWQSLVQCTEKIKARPTDDRGRRALIPEKSRISSPRFAFRLSGKIVGAIALCRTRNKRDQRNVKPRSDSLEQAA